MLLPIPGKKGKEAAAKEAAEARGDVERYLKKNGRIMGVVEVTCKAAELVAKQPERRERAAKSLQDMASFDLADWLRTLEAQ